MNSSFNYAKTLGGGSYSGLKQAILRPETGGILFTDDQLINEELNTEFRTFSNEYDVYNPLITNDAIINRKLSRIFSVNAGVDIDFLKDFTFRTAGSYNWAQIKTTNFDDGRTANAQLKGGPYGSIDNKERYAYQWTNTLNWKHTFEKHDLGVLLGHELYYTNTSGTETAYKAFPDTNFGLNDISMATPDTWKSSLEENALLSFFGRLNYTFNDRYLFTATLRADGSSKLGANNKWGFFPSASLAWVLKEEAFLKNVDFLTNLKLRAGYGLTGNQDAIGAYNSLKLMSPTGVTTINGKPVVTYGINRNENPDLKWEVKRMFDVGLDWGFFDDRLSGSVDYYYSKTSDLLYNYAVPVPPFAFSTLLANLGEMENSGVEVAITGVPLRTKDMELTISANFSWQKNKLLSLDGTYMGQSLSAKEYMNLGGMNGAGFIGGNNQIIYQMVGQPVGVFYLPKCDGLIDMKGNGEHTYHILDIDGEEGVDRSDGKDRYIAGQAMPKFYLGGNINFRYKQFDIQTQFSGAFGHKIYNGTSLSYMNMSLFPTYNVMEGAPEKNIHDQTVTDYWLERGDYVHIDYITLGWNLNTKNLKNINALRITFSVNNVATITNYSGLSPMINSATVGSDLGIDDKRFYPLTRTYSLGLSLNF